MSRSLTLQEAVEALVVELMALRDTMLDMLLPLMRTLAYYVRMRDMNRTPKDAAYDTVLWLAHKRS